MVHARAITHFLRDCRVHNICVTYARDLRGICAVFSGIFRVRDKRASYTNPARIKRDVCGVRCAHKGYFWPHPNLLSISVPLVNLMG
jgi:hypothetical protein